MELVAILCELTALKGLPWSLNVCDLLQSFKDALKFNKVLSCSSYWRLRKMEVGGSGGGNIVPPFSKLFDRPVKLYFS